MAAAILVAEIMVAATTVAEIMAAATLGEATLVAVISGEATFEMQGGALLGDFESQAGSADNDTVD